MIVIAPPSQRQLLPTLLRMTTGMPLFLEEDRSGGCLKVSVNEIFGITLAGVGDIGPVAWNCRLTILFPTERAYPRCIESVTTQPTGPKPSPQKVRSTLGTAATRVSCRCV